MKNKEIKKIKEQKEQKETPVSDGDTRPDKQPEGEKQNISIF